MTLNFRLIQSYLQSKNTLLNSEKIIKHYFENLTFADKKKNYIFKTFKKKWSKIKKKKKKSKKKVIIVTKISNYFDF